MLLQSEIWLVALLITLLLQISWIILNYHQNSVSWKSLYPKAIRNKTLSESNIRAKYGLNVVAIKRHDNLIISPLPTEVLLENDIAIVVGSNESINGLEALEK